MQIETTLRQFVFVSNIVVAGYKIKRCVEYMDQTGKILRRQITAGNKDINPGKRLVTGILVQHRVHNIRY